ncbi:D-alanyl-D-alanine carboxypeptidase/D-alanyl-D-alanine-endopeptidase [Actinomadura viridis]|uniref:D-alanyl-D-alanine carboxypeptidase/D-alanyl-D-alanine-endopeptidase (Penicillin-binding protein 4) n=1 Tax=Actinomadura viridis TaxID=58110 RepID=A0A931GGV9_9ACTN|nr:D-alanyl-D-alanine carboxypeptidase/D-alanyl-D-alanine-endopeptidase [Actinomadura viridis]MBG6086192.1 D-alanyl-D-alanine carboxypeptidase/D-alanyl-D-alanine-endopeptidase (penicillin-binding protein 4) [Actinomadura viridis]
MPKQATGLVLITLSLLNVFVTSAGLAVAKLTPERRLAPSPPSAAERLAVRTAVTRPPAGSGAPMPAAQALSRRLTPVLTGAGTRIGAVVTDAATRRVLFAADADRPATPASTTKLVTSVAALDTLGPTHRITTRTVRGAGGGVVLVGGGDPTLTARPPRPSGPGDPGAGRPVYASLADLARQTAAALKAEGVRRVRVDHDVSAYQGPRTARGWKPNYLPDGEVAPVSALTVDEGRIAPGDPTENKRVADPPAAATKAFARMLTREGVEARPGRAVTAPAGAAELGAVRSPTAAELVEHLMTRSDNDVAEAMARQVAIKLGRPGSSDEAARAVTEVLARLGVTGGVLVNDGSGLSTANRITPAALAVLVSVAASPEHPHLRAAITGMPVAGFSGTLNAPRYTVPASRAGAGVVRAKTGTLAGVSTLAGIAHDADGRTLAFAFMAGDGTGPVDPGTLDRLAAAVASCGC